MHLHMLQVKCAMGFVVLSSLCLLWLMSRLGVGAMSAATSVLVVVAGDWMAVVVIARVINNVMRRVEGGEVISACIF
jgi:uncharacterized membrane protein AbrB (regulator of aidB expression)